MALGRQGAFRPFAARSNRTIIAILVTIALVSTVGVALSIKATSRSKNRAVVVEIAARQRTLAERYVKEVLLVRDGYQADPAGTGKLLASSAGVLLDGGEVEAVPGDDDEVEVPGSNDPEVRAQLEQQQRLVRDLTGVGAAYLAHKPVEAVPLTAKERIDTSDPVRRLRTLADLTSNVSLNTARTIASQTDRNITDVIRIQAALGAGGLLISLLLAWALIAATRRQTAHFRSLVTSSTDLVLVFGGGGCRYVSKSVTDMLARPEADLLGEGFRRFLHPDDQPLVQTAREHGEPHSLVFRLRNRFGEWRHLEAHVTDLRGDRQVRGVVLNARDTTERVRLEEELTRQAFHDGLTDLANRALFRDRLDQALARSERSREVLAVLLVDLDGFKQVNDSLGHDAGDQVLQEVARRFTEISRPSDTLARLGGDEFALLLEGVNEQGATMTAGRLLDRLADPVAVAGREFALGASVGIVLHPGGKGDREELIRHADVAMYAAKESGRGRYEVFQYDMAREFGEVLGLEHEMRLGLQRGEFTVHYQPEIELESDSIVGAEALLRWRSPDRGDVPPDQFIPIAEATGLIMPIGKFVLREACMQAAEWRRDGRLPEKFTMWVNLSGRQLTSGGLTGLVEQVLAEANLPPENLGLEVTETAVVADGTPGDRARAELRGLHERGVQIAIDDFGTGVSSLGQLRRFPVDMIKVDRSFIQGVEHDAKDAAIAANLVSLAHALGLVAVAEGIESDGQLTSMRELDCDLAQGFLFARPVPAGDMTDMLVEQGRSAKRPGSRTAAA
jgi:diguanylate cyclase (GGDEF)-like protein/PAS domain S-box-containing protein